MGVKGDKRRCGDDKDSDEGLLAYKTSSSVKALCIFQH